MKIIYYILILNTLLFSTDVELKTSGNIETSYIRSNDLNSTLIEANINNDLCMERFKIGSSVGVYANNNSVYNNNVSEYVEKVEIYRINELYISMYLTDNLTYSFGVFPFKRGNFYEYSYNGNKSGIGIYTLSDANLQGSILTYKLDNQTIQAGSVAYEKYFTTYVDRESTNGPITFDSYKDSGMYYLSYSIDYDKWFTEFMVTDTFQYVNGVKILSTNTYTTALSYDEEDETGRIYYTVFTYSTTEGDNTSLSPTGPFQNDKYFFDKFNTDGYSLLLGIKQEVDSVIFNKDMVFGFEYLKRSAGYHSLLAGEPLSYDSYSNIGDTYSTYAGLRLNKDILVKLRYQYYDARNKMTKGILTTVDGPLIKEDGNGNHESLILQLYIDF